VSGCFFLNKVQKLKRKGSPELRLGHAVARCLLIRLSDSRSRSGILSKRLNVSSKIPSLPARFVIQVFAEPLRVPKFRRWGHPERGRETLVRSVSCQCMSSIAVLFVSAIEEFNVDRKAECGQLNLAHTHVTRNLKNIKNEETETKSKYRVYLHIAQHRPVLR